MTKKDEQVSGVFVEFQMAVLRALPRNIADDVCLGWTRDGEGLAKFLSGLCPREETEEPETPQLPEYPAPGVVFTLTMDGDALENQPNEMPRRDGYTGLTHNGERVVPGTQTRNFMFVEIGYQPNWESVVRELQKKGKIPQGQWREAVKSTYRTNGRPMGVADPSWVNPDSSDSFPYVSENGKSDFHWTDYAFGEHWLWPVEVK